MASYGILLALFLLAMVSQFIQLDYEPAKTTPTAAATATSALLLAMTTVASTCAVSAIPTVLSFASCTVSSVKATSPANTVVGLIVNKLWAFLLSGMLAEGFGESQLPLAPTKTLKALPGDVPVVTGFNLVLLVAEATATAVPKVIASTIAGSDVLWIQAPEKPTLRSLGSLVGLSTDLWIPLVTFFIFALVSGFIGYIVSAQRQSILGLQQQLRNSVWLSQEQMNWIEELELVTSAQRKLARRQGARLQANSKVTVRQRREIKDLKRRLSLKDQAIARLQLKLQASETLVGEKVREIGEIKSEISALNQEIQRLRGDLRAGKDLAEELRGQIRDLEDAVSRRDEAAVGWAEKVKALKEQAEDAEAKVDVAEAKVKAAEAKADAAGSKAEAAEAVAEDAKARAEAAEAKAEAVEAQAVAWEAEAEEAEADTEKAKEEEEAQRVLAQEKAKEKRLHDGSVVDRMKYEAPDESHGDPMGTVALLTSEALLFRHDPYRTRSGRGWHERENRTASLSVVLGPLAQNRSSLPIIGIPKPTAYNGGWQGIAESEARPVRKVQASVPEEDGGQGQVGWVASTGLNKASPGGEGAVAGKKPKARKVRSESAKESEKARTRRRRDAKRALTLALTQGEGKEEEAGGDEEGIEEGNEEEEE